MSSRWPFSSPFVARLAFENVRANRPEYIRRTASFIFRLYFEQSANPASNGVEMPLRSRRICDSESRVVCMCRPHAQRRRGPLLFGRLGRLPPLIGLLPLLRSIRLIDLSGYEGSVDRCANAELTMRDLMFGFRHDEKNQRCRTALPCGQKR